jgi:uncharacterized protein (DUF1501 family)
MAEGHGPAFLEPASGDAAPVLRLARDDVPIRGQVIDIRGRPVAGATIQLVGILRPHSGTLDEWLDALKRERSAYYTQHGSYDTHAGQLRPHASLLFELSETLRRFQDNLNTSGLADRALVLCFSEFGRRVHENASGGTDHGTAGPVFLVGKHVRAGLVGETPSLLAPEDGDLKMAVDFRRIYAAVLQDWLALPAAGALGGRFDPLPVIRT